MAAAGLISEKFKPLKAPNIHLLIISILFAAMNADLFLLILMQKVNLLKNTILRITSPMINA